MTDRDGLLRGIIASPDDDLPRLLYADCLDDAGGPPAVARAEFIRLQCRIEDGTLSAKQATAFWPRIKELLREFDGAWRAELPELPGVVFRRFRRGFVDEVRFSGWDRFQEHAGAVFAAVPVQRLHFPRLLYRCVQGQPLDSPYLERIAELDLSGPQMYDAVLVLVGACRRLGKVRRLTLVQRSGERIIDSFRSIHIPGARALTESPHLNNLEVLFLRGSQVTPAARALLIDRFGDRVRF